MAFGIYVHIPFCRKKCPYCSFSSIENSSDIFEKYKSILIREYFLRNSDTFSGKPETLYIGGGTPSIFPQEYIKDISKAIGEVSKEFTVEANPESLNGQWLDGILSAGANRISIGVQSFDNAILNTLGRIHSADDAIKAINTSVKSGFKNVSLDLMFGIPGQTLEIWEETLKITTGLGPAHVSCYSLSVEEDTEYFRLFGNKVTHPDESETADMYLAAVDTLESNGIMQYEISNYAKPGFESVHNKSYWSFIPYLGLGASAHSFDGSMRSWNIRNPIEYIEKLDNGSGVREGEEILDDKTLLTEELMLSMRMKSGFDIKKLEDRKIDDMEGLNKILELSVKEGIIEIISPGKYCLTQKGFLISNEFISEILTHL